MGKRQQSAFPGTPSFLSQHVFLCHASFILLPTSLSAAAISCVAMPAGHEEARSKILSGPVGQQSATYIGARAESAELELLT